MINCGCTTGNITSAISGIEIKDSQYLNYTISKTKGREKICFLECLKTKGCKDASYEETMGQCRLHFVSPFNMNFDGEIVERPSSKLFHFQSAENPWTPIAKFSTSGGVFNESDSWEVWSDPSSSVNTDPCSKAGEDINCTRHYVHKYKEWVLGVGFISQVKISLYDNGEEVAWAIFRKLPGSDDTWFQPSRVIDSFPWDPELLRQSTTEMSLEPQPGNERIRFYIVDKHIDEPFAGLAAFKYWMKIVESESVCSYGKFPVPQILYSRGPEPTMLTQSSVANFQGWNGGYSISETEGLTFL